jgi:Flp pilus assembly pilin Flp
VRSVKSVSRRQQRGAAMIEYAVVTMVAVLVLVAEPNIVLELVESIRKAYQGFTYMLSMGIV